MRKRRTQAALRNENACSINARRWSIVPPNSQAFHLEPEDRNQKCKKWFGKDLGNEDIRNYMPCYVRNQRNKKTLHSDNASRHFKHVNANSERSRSRRNPINKKKKKPSHLSNAPLKNFHQTERRKKPAREKNNLNRTHFNRKIKSQYARVIQQWSLGLGSPRTVDRHAPYTPYIPALRWSNRYHADRSRRSPRANKSPLRYRAYYYYLSTVRWWRAVARHYRLARALVPTNTPLSSAARSALSPTNRDEVCEREREGERGISWSQRRQTAVAITFGGALAGEGGGDSSFRGIDDSSIVEGSHLRLLFGRDVVQRSVHECCGGESSRKEASPLNIWVRKFEVWKVEVIKGGSVWWFISSSSSCKEGGIFLDHLLSGLRLIFGSIF